MTRISLALALASLAAAATAPAQSAADFKAMEQQIQQLQAKVTKLQKEQADTTVNNGAPTASAYKNPVEDAASKILLSSGVTQLKLYGDLRLRYQYDQYHPEVSAPSLITDDRNRFRYRLRIGADVKLGDQFFAGVTLASGQNADSNSVTYTEGYDNYAIYIDKAYAGWTPNDWFTLVVGKQANPLYTTDLVWDPDITPTAITETFDLSKAFLPDNTPLSLQLIGLQGIYQQGGSFSVGADNAWQFAEQLRGTYHFGKNTSVTFAPGFMTYTSASLSGLLNAQPFSKPNDALTAPNGVQTQTTTTQTQTETIKYDATGKPSITLTPVNVTTQVTTTDPATGATRNVTTQTENNQVQKTIPFGGKGNTLKQNTALANQTFVNTKTVGGGTTTVTSPTGRTPTAETRDIALITAPGDVTFQLGGLKTKVYWDFSYNAESSERSSREYFLSNHSAQDDFAWLAGIQVGDNAKAGDWSVFANYRPVGLDAIHPNLNDSEFALSYLNVQGVKLGVAYNFTDSLVGAITYYGAWNLRGGITGGEATGGSQLANAKKVDVLEVDMNLKF